jgi:hypothetical protein
LWRGGDEEMNGMLRVDCTKDLPAIEIGARRRQNLKRMVSVLELSNPNGFLSFDFNDTYFI